MYILPSKYGWLLPYNEIYTKDIIDELALSGEYPSFDGLIWAIPLSLLFGFVRLLLNPTFFAV